MSESLRLELRDGVAHLTLARPERQNALDLELCRALMDATRALHDEPGVRAVLLRGAGGIFCGGGDVKVFASRGEALPRYVREMATCFHAAVSHLVRLEAPVIGAVDGAAAGGGVSLACACDLVLAAESARFVMAYTRIGLSIDGGSSYFLSRFLGMRRALELVLTNRMLSAAEALEWGLVTRLVPDAALHTEAEKLATELALGATRALGASKRLLHRGWNESLETQMELETTSISDVSGGPDAREGIRAFLDKRRPDFEGR